MHIYIHVHAHIHTRGKGRERETEKVREKGRDITNPSMLIFGMCGGSRR